MVITQVLHALYDALPTDFAADLAQQNPPPVDGKKLANGLQDFIAPIAAILIGVVALKFLFGENKSLAGFIGFMVLAVVVFALIKFGNQILGALASTVQSWT